MKKINIEVWKSNDNQEEIHIFLADERNTYLVGFNPKLISKEKVTEFLKEVGYE